MCHFSLLFSSVCGFTRNYLLYRVKPFFFPRSSHLHRICKQRSHGLTSHWFVNSSSFLLWHFHSRGTCVCVKHNPASFYVTHAKCLLTDNHSSSGCWKSAKNRRKQMRINSSPDVRLPSVNFTVLSSSSMRNHLLSDISINLLLPIKPSLCNVW